MSSSPALATYKKKRNFKLTPEPSGRPKAPGKKLTFVIQKHLASHLHYDFRLEAAGVLKSWAVPKGPSTDPIIKRLAIEVEDHPLDYAHFEGVIPKGQYGGGNVIIWDEGTYRDLPQHDGTTLPLVDAIKKGHVLIWLDGKKLHGGFALTRTGYRGNKPQWLIVKIQDDEAHRPADPVGTLPQSVVSGKVVETMAKPKAGELPDLPKAAPPPATVPMKKAWVEPMLATLVDKPFDRPGWIYESKLDGERCLAYKKGKELKLFSRHQQGLNITYPEILKALAAQKTDFIIDGEVVAFEQGTEKTSFRQLQSRMHLKTASDVGLSKVKVFYYIFDILALDGRDLRRLPLLERKALLQKNLRFKDPLRLNTFKDEGGETLFREACKKGLEGVIAKRAESPYISGRSKDWVKFKCVSEQEFVIGGYSDPEGARESLGALLIGYYEGSELKYAGKVGTGFNAASLNLIAKKLKSLTRQTSPFTSIDISHRGLHWVEPKFVAQIGFSEWTEEGKLRHPRYIGLRDDKEAAEVMREKPVPEKAVVSPSPRAPAKAASSKSSSTLTVDGKSVTLSHLDKVYYPSTGFTKGQMLDYYIKAAPVLLPLLKGRPMTLKRYPDGVEGNFFYEKQAPSYRPPWLKTYAMHDDKSDRTTNYPVVNDVASLLWLTNLATIELHVLLSRAPQVESPTMIAFDLDPGAPADMIDAARVGLQLRTLLDQLGLKSFPKTSGNKGLHVYVPLNTPITYEKSQNFAHAIALFLEKQQPAKIISNMKRELRTGKIFVDWSQNSRHKTTVAAYSLRATPVPSVSTPVTWKEVEGWVEKGKRAQFRFTPEQVIDRIAKKGDLFAQVETLKQKLPELSAALSSNLKPASGVTFSIKSHGKNKNTLKSRR